MDPTFKGLGAPTPTKMRTSNASLRKTLVITGGFLLLVIVIGVAVSLLTPNNATLSQRFLYRLDALDTLTSTAQASIQDDNLSKVNADLSLVLTGDITSINKLIATAKTTPELTAIKTEEADKTTTDNLKTAQINGQYDSTYKTVLKQKVAAANALAVELAGKTTDTQLKQALATLQSHLQTYYTQLTGLQ
jgi:hypothetical protein